MSIRPVDVQMMLHKMPGIVRATNADGSRAAIQNAHFSDSMQKAVEQESKQVANTQMAEKTNVNKDGRGRGQAQPEDKSDPQRRPKPGQDEASSDRNAIDAKNSKHIPPRGNMLDIKI